MSFEKFVMTFVFPNYQLYIYPKVFQNKTKTHLNLEILGAERVEEEVNLPDVAIKI